MDLIKKHNRHWLVFRFLKNIIGLNFKQNRSLQGIRIQISGKINGFSRKRKRVLSWGTLPLQTISNKIDYSYRVAITKFGVFGIKVWLYKN